VARAEAALARARAGEFGDDSEAALERAEVRLRAVGGSSRSARRAGVTEKRAHKVSGFRRTLAVW